MTILFPGSEIETVTVESQNKRIRKHLESGMSITPSQARLSYGSDRLGARINDLRKIGVEIDGEIATHKGKHFAKYWLRKYFPVGAKKYATKY